MHPLPRLHLADWIRLDTVMISGVPIHGDLDALLVGIKRCTIASSCSPNTGTGAKSSGECSLCGPGTYQTGSGGVFMDLNAHLHMDNAVRI
jgi:hypothetical protein